MSGIVVLCSGGIDSAALIGLAQEAGHEVAALFVDYGQPSYIKEGTASFCVAEHFNVGHYRIHCNVRLGDMGKGSGAHVVPARNMVLISLAVNFALSKDFDEVWLGAISDDYLEYTDCRLGFAIGLDRASEMLGVRVRYPWVNGQRGKSFVTGAARRYGVPFEKTYSCYASKKCGVCPSCLERARVLK